MAISTVGLWPETARRHITLSDSSRRRMGLQTETPGAVRQSRHTTPLLAPDIVEAVLDGRHPASLTSPVERDRSRQFFLVARYPRSRPRLSLVRYANGENV